MARQLYHKAVIVLAHEKVSRSDFSSWTKIMGLIHFQAELFTTCATGLRASVIRCRCLKSSRG